MAALALLTLALVALALSGLDVNGSALVALYFMALEA